MTPLGDSPGSSMSTLAWGNASNARCSITQAVWGNAFCWAPGFPMRTCALVSHLVPCIGGVAPCHASVDMEALPPHTACVIPREGLAPRYYTRSQHSHGATPPMHDARWFTNAPQCDQDHPCALHRLKSQLLAAQNSGNDPHHHLSGPRLFGNRLLTETGEN